MRQELAIVVQEKRLSSFVKKAQPFFLNFSFRLYHVRMSSKNGTYNGRPLNRGWNGFYGMLGIPMMPSIHRAVSSYPKEAGDKQVPVFQLPDTTAQTVGSRTHSGRLAHERAAREPAGYLAEILSR
ncbi:hypothetical protein [Paenibacillus sp. S150]|uniref:hypothetical protein n=1 Tax=Paenibacillus sp. S150 TaxID=2749826 RepID=UPI001C5A388F|nr:hypothetical protein [Paenibacillus sp. S150]MBW4083705.1 hypothetical protein [Paenibacillus sp. S150]